MAHRLDCKRGGRGFDYYSKELISSFSRGINYFYFLVTKDKARV